jgi:DNA-binding response OmpR family regulator
MKVTENMQDTEKVKKKGLSNPILVVDDDARISSLIVSTLQDEGYPTISAADGEEALTLTDKHDPVLVILDIMLPKIDGIEVCRQIRKKSDVPILMLSVKADEFDKILGLSIGADDYLTKPFSPRELTARVKAILRRTLPKSPGSAKKVRHLDLEIDYEKCKVSIQDHEVKLSVYEYKILEALSRYPGRVFSREELIQKIYYYEDVSIVDRVIDVHIGNLRAKVEEESSRPKHILTVRGMGYKFAEIDTE